MLSLLIDAGASRRGYASDITRTHSREDADFAALIGRMDRMQQALCAGMRAGVDWRDVQLQAHALTAGVLREADIILCGAEEAVATGVTSVFLPHGIGHLLGLEVHDVGGFMRSPEGGDIPRPDGHPYLRLTRVLEEGFVVTMEPGIYFIDQLLDEARGDARAAHINWSRVGSLSKFGGIRIEDDLAVTRTGCENLTRDAFARQSLKRPARMESGARRPPIESLEIQIYPSCEQIPDFLQQYVRPARGRRRGVRLRPLHRVDGLDHHEDDQGDDQELEAGLQEGAVLDQHRLAGGSVAM